MFKNKNKISDQAGLMLLSLPAIVFFLVFSYAPMFGLIIAFKKIDYRLGILNSPWVGFNNFMFFFKSVDAWRITRNTVGYGLLLLILGIITAVIVALLLYEIRSKLAIKVYQTSMMLPYFLSWVIVGYITYAIFNADHGILNSLLIKLHFSPIDVYSSPQYWPFIIPIANIWKGVGPSMIFYYAALMGIDESLFEAAVIDGANTWQRTWNISIPSLIPIICMLSILGIGGILNGDFGLYYQIPRNLGILYPTTDVIATYVYRGLTNGAMEQTAAVGFLQSVIGLILVLGTNAIVKKIDPDFGMF